MIYCVCLMVTVLLLPGSVDAESREAFLCRNVLKFIDQEKGSIQYGLLTKESKEALRIIAQNPFSGKDTYQQQDTIKGILSKMNIKSSGRGMYRFRMIEAMLRELKESSLARTLPRDTLQRTHEGYMALVDLYHTMIEFSTDHSTWYQRVVLQRCVDADVEGTLKAMLDLEAPLKETCAIYDKDQRVEL
eukprot:PhF_6_TR13332/c0_g1_i1/m.21124